jgi:sugar phosphate isomerase/epimerase
MSAGAPAEGHGGDARATRPVTLFTGQWADLPLDTLAAKAAGWGYDGLELACWGDHFDVARALTEDGYVDAKRDQLAAHGLKVWAISNHLVGQAVCDKVDERHRAILPARIWGDGDPDGVSERAAAEMKDTARAARALGVDMVNGFTGSAIWPYLYAFPPLTEGAIEMGFADFARQWIPILDVFDEQEVGFALEVHPTEIAFDTVTAFRALEAIEWHSAFGFNYDPSHLAYQGVDYLGFLRELGPRVLHVHMKDVWWQASSGPSGTFGGHLDFGHPDRAWDFRSIGRGRVDFEGIIRELHRTGYRGPLSVEWEDSGMDREFGAREACARVRAMDFPPAERAFDAAFSDEG